MKQRRLPVVTFVLCSALGVSPRLLALDISTGEIAALSVSPACLDYRIVGACFFLVCEIFECHIETTARISHFLPDVVVSSYQRTGENPWSEIAGLGGAGAVAVGDLSGTASGILVDGGHQREGTRIEAHENVRFKEVDVIGNPIVSGSELANTAGFLCAREAASPRSYPAKLPPVGYGTEVTVRRVRHNGEIKWKGHLLYVSDILAKEPMA